MMAILLGIIVGLALGLTGGGGSILAVPLLIYGLDVAPKSAITLSLAVVALTALFGALMAWRHRLLELRAAMIFSAAGIVAAPAGILLGDQVSDRWLLIGFAVLMMIVALRMLANALRHPEQASVVRADFEHVGLNDTGTVCHYSHDGRLRLTAPCGLVLALMGVLAGLLSGLFGVGGGFVIVPALMLVTEMSIHRAVATSLLVITLVGLSGTASALAGDRPLDWFVGGLFLIGGLIGMGLGRAVAHRLAGPRLQQLFALVMIAVATYLLMQQWAVMPTGVMT
ncbi:putative membrane protein YfcA [Methylohalomonas lacus]|uniref:Probable membrane transporter protein n=1 Tax=Methylohalomonas lacus TaxID=398773 RepID=A0AAE3HMF1_9GAMM|nr:sulfite exporter TauE/SafE family protein [Methylohalomonas lacus]MCS3904008.1 putative membrane protein YfcA [Methylohalomonas lacus]